MKKGELRAAREEIGELIDSGMIETYLGIDLDGAGHYPLLRDTLRELIGVGVRKLSYAKNKFGQLRIVLGEGSPPEGRPIVREAEQRSLTLCIRCGEPGILRRDLSWTAVLCESHHRDGQRTGRALGDWDADDFGDQGRTRRWLAGIEAVRDGAGMRDPWLRAQLPDRLRELGLSAAYVLADGEALLLSIDLADRQMPTADRARAVAGAIDLIEAAEGREVVFDRLRGDEPAASNEVCVFDDRGAR